MHKNWLTYLWYQLYAYRPRFREKAFWLVQGIIIFIAVSHDYGEVLGLFSSSSSLYFLTIALFFIPVVYAALHYGFAGSLATALWVMIVTIPDWALWHHSLEDRLGVILSLVLVNGLAVYIGRRIDREKAARYQAEISEDALKVSEIKYRSLFETSPVPILALDSAGTILDANPAASILFDIGTKMTASNHLAELVGEESSQKLIEYSMEGKQNIESISVKLKNGSTVRLLPDVTKLGNLQDGAVIQVVLRDVTDDYNQQVGLRAYATFIARTQEEERQRIAHELHDDTIQSLVLLCRQLDTARAFSKTLQPALGQELAEARKTVDYVVNTLRTFTTSLRPSYLDDLGIIHAIHRLLRDIRNRSEIDTQIKVVGKYQRLQSDIELGIFRIAQEALRNAERHSKASRITVTILITEDEIRLEIDDNGIGFTIPPTTTDYIASHQLGIIGMTERASLLGGNLEILSNPNTGSRITAVIVIPKNNDNGSDI